MSTATETIEPTAKPRHRQKRPRQAELIAPTCKENCQIADTIEQTAAALSPDHSLKESDCADKLLTRAHRRYESAMESLVRLRKLNLPKKANPARSPC